jgi:Fe-S-cluster containining protein
MIPMLSKKTFKCKRCGECCKKYTIKLYKKDVERIGKKYPTECFTQRFEIGPFNDTILRKINGKCMFLTGKKGHYKCEIYNIRPKICKEYPFFGRAIESCMPVTFASLTKSNKYKKKLIYIKNNKSLSRRKK